MFFGLALLGQMCRVKGQKVLFPQPQTSHVDNREDWLEGGERGTLHVFESEGTCILLHVR